MNEETRCKSDFLLLAQAEQSASDAKAMNDSTERMTQLRKAAEQTWGALVGVLDDAFGVRGNGPEAHVDREEAFRKDDHAMYLQYLDVKNELHGKCFYDGRCVDPSEVESHINRSKKIMEKYRTRC
jgi:hypothetical protein